MKILILDIETTGLSPQNNKIVEVGIVELDLASGKSKVLFDEVTHEYGITRSEVENSWIVKNSSLTTEIVRRSKRLDALAPKIQNIINDYPCGCTAYNNRFDFSFLESRGFYFPKKLEDPMKILTPILKLPKKSGYGFKWPSVEDSIKHYLKEENYSEEHRGAQDALDESRIVYKLFLEGHFKL